MNTMGISDLLIRQDEQGWDFSDKNVCDNCIEEEVLKAIVQDALDHQLNCHFCGSNSAAHLDVLLEAFFNGLRNEYRTAGEEGVIHDRREGGYQCDEKWDTWELIDKYSYSFANGDIVQAVQEVSHMVCWVRRDFITRRIDVALNDSWQEFCEAVKHETRYIFWRLPIDEDLGAGEIPPAEVLDEVGRLINEHKLIRPFSTSCRIWRAQTHKSFYIEHTAARLGTVPKEKALAANRMSPAGIPKFYGAMDDETAIQEVAYKCRDFRITWTEFELTDDVSVVDLTDLPNEPSLFDPELGHQRRYIRFLHQFVAQLSERVEHNEIEYVPTQAVAEYLLHILGEHTPIKGIIYRSSLNGKKCVMFDIPNENCVDEEAEAPETGVGLRLVSQSTKSRRIKRKDRRAPKRPDENAESSEDGQLPLF